MNWHATPARILLALVGATAAIAATPALASAHHGQTRVAGTYAVYDFGTTECVPKNAAGDILTCTTTGLKSSYTGGLAGDVTSDFTSVVDCRRGRTYGHGVETFTGAVNSGGQGTLAWKIAFHARFDCTIFAPYDFHGWSWIARSSGGLAGTQGVLHFGDTTYDGLLRT